MPKKQSLFTEQERRIALYALVAAAVMATSMVALDQWLTPQLGIYATDSAPPRLPNVIDARPMSRVARF